MRSLVVAVWSKLITLIAVHSKADHCKIPAAAFLKLLKLLSTARGGCENLRGKGRQRGAGPVIYWALEPLYD